MLFRTFPRRYLHDIADELVPPGIQPPRFCSSLDPHYRRQVWKSLAVTPITVREREIHLLTIGSSMAYDQLLKDRVPLRHGIATVLELSVSSVKLGLMRPHKPKQGNEGRPTCYGRRNPPPRQQVLNTTDQKGRNVLVRTSLDVIVGKEIAPESDIQLELAAVLWTKIEERTHAELTRFGICYCDVPEYQPDFYFDRFLGEAITPEEVETLRSEDRQRQMEVDFLA